MNPDTKKHIIEAIETHKKMTANFGKDGIETVAAIAGTITNALKQDGTVYLCGNGGSAADAQHIAGEFVGRFARERKPLAAVAFSTDTSVLTCIANDYSYEQIFARQAEALVRNGDILWAFSTSGTSPNVIAAARIAKEKGACVIAFTGRAGSVLEQMADICLCADAESTARSQEIHQLAYHIICDLIEKDFTSG
ncbi:MAG: SIS domain-containing protein [Sedimentisphaerales bacterium]|nr:SIS domain-containing protein [Sedimentisphaerales bacterium]